MQTTAEMLCQVLLPKINYPRYTVKGYSEIFGGIRTCQQKWKRNVSSVYVSI